jgi:hypothetical protein
MSLSLSANKIMPEDAPDRSVSVLVLFLCSDMIGSGSDEAHDRVIPLSTGSVSEDIFFTFFGGMG